VVRKNTPETEVVAGLAKPEDASLYIEERPQEADDAPTETSGLRRNNPGRAHRPPTTQSQPSKASSRDRTGFAFKAGNPAIGAIAMRPARLPSSLARSS